MILTIKIIIKQPSEVKKQPSEQPRGAKQAGAKLAYNTRRYYAPHGYRAQYSYCTRRNERMNAMLTHAGKPYLWHNYARTDPAVKH